MAEIKTKTAVGGTLKELNKPPAFAEGRLNKPKELLTSLIFYFAILMFIIGFNFSDNRAGGWTQQFMPDLGGRQISDITFLDSLTGYASARQTSDTSYILKTTNGGDNWQIIYRNFLAMTHLQFLNANTGYAVGAYLYKTTNGGLNWAPVNAPAISPEELYVLNEDTIWIISSESLTGGVYRTTNGGASWEQQATFGNGNPSRIYMFNRNIGFISEATGQTLRMTTDGGFNWSSSTNGAFTDMFFADSLTGWKSGAPGGPGALRKTTDGGLNWFDQEMPSGGNIVAPLLEKISGLSSDTIWGTGSQILTIFGIRGMVNRTTNGGNNWYFQVPDSTYNNNKYNYLDFYNRLNGWAYLTVNRGIHTTTGGDPIFYTSTKQISSNIPSEFKLFQNYPNPFNPVTNIKYQIARLANGQIKNSYVKLEVFDVSGRIIKTLVNREQKPGEYSVEFDGSNLSSGIYFYRIQITNEKGGVLYVETKKAILIK